MKWIKRLNDFKIDESLTVSNDVSQIIHDLADTKEDDKVAKFLVSVLQSSGFYSDDEDLNMIDVAKEFNMFSFVPKNRRKEDYRFEFNQESMPTRIGKVVNKIYSKCKKYLKLKAKSEAKVSIHESGAAQQFYISLPDNIKLLVPINPKDSDKPELKITILGKYNTDGTLVKNKNKDKFDLKITGLRQAFCLRNWITTESGYGLESWIKVEVDTPELEHKLLEYQDQNLLFMFEFNSNVDIKDQDVEAFTNKVIAYQKISRSDDSAIIEEVEGEDIRYWYHRDNYLSEKGELGNSCMSYGKCQRFLDIYCENTGQVSLLILKNQEGKLLGRAILWKLDDGRYLVDRCYTILNADVSIFYAWAKKKGYYYVKSHAFYLDSKKVDLSPEVTLDYCNFRYYPYLDSLECLNMRDSILSNSVTGDISDVRILKSTGGSYEDAEQNDEYYEDDEFGGDDD